MSRAPDLLTLSRHRDLEGREHRPYVRWALLTLVGILVLLGLLNVFGQKPHTDTASAERGRARGLLPAAACAAGSSSCRGSRFAREREIEAATLVLDPGWLEGITLNTLVPSPVGEANRDGKIALDLGHVPAGSEHVFFLHFQVNPTEVGRRSQDVALYDGETPLLDVDRTVTIFP